MKLSKLAGAIVFVILVGLSVAPASGAFSAGVTVNRSTILNFRNGVERVSIANPAIADLLLISPHQVQINGRTVGATTIIVWERGVSEPSLYELRVAGDLNGIESQLRAITESRDIRAEYVNDTIVLTGKVDSEKTREKADQLAKVFAGKVINYLTINKTDQVLLQVKVAQIDKTAMKQLGISGVVKGKTAEGFINLVGAPTSQATSSFGTNSGIAGNAPGLGSFNPLDPLQLGVSHFPAGVGAVIKALSTKNLAKLLAEPNLLVKSGQKGNLLAGSRIPYTVVTSTGGTATTSIVFVDVGVKLGFAPDVMENGTISLKIDPAEVSSISGTLNVNGYPIIDTREVRTNVELKDGESLILAGLLQEEVIKTMAKIPVLGDIPVLGSLFRSTQEDLKEKELVFFITPKVVKPTPPGTTVPLPTDQRQPWEEKQDLDQVPR